LHREISEEIGIIKIEKIIPLEKFTADNKNFEYHTYVVVVSDEFVPTLNDEHRGYAWTSIEDHPKPLHPGVWRTFSFSSVINKLKTLEQITHQLQEQIV
jgi:8-oxo-dGTP pyrophosphatase MutT (NUDIX family)